MEQTMEKLVVQLEQSARQGFGWILRDDIALAEFQMLDDSHGKAAEVFRGFVRRLMSTSLVELGQVLLEGEAFWAAEASAAEVLRRHERGGDVATSTACAALDLLLRSQPALVEAIERWYGQPRQPHGDGAEALARAEELIFRLTDIPTLVSMRAATELVATQLLYAQEQDQKVLRMLLDHYFRPGRSWLSTSRSIGVMRLLADLGDEEQQRALAELFYWGDGGVVQSGGLASGYGEAVFRQHEDNGELASWLVRIYEGRLGDGAGPKLRRNGSPRAHRAYEIVSKHLVHIPGYESYGIQKLMRYEAVGFGCEPSPEREGELRAQLARIPKFLSVKGKDKHDAQLRHVGEIVLSGKQPGDEVFVLVKDPQLRTTLRLVSLQDTELVLVLDGQGYKGALDAQGEVRLRRCKDQLHLVPTEPQFGDSYLFEYR